MSLLLQHCLRAAQVIGRTNALRQSSVLHTKSSRNESMLLPQNTCHYMRKSAATSAAINWTPIYRLPMIRWAAAFNRLKFYQTILTVASIPAVYALEDAGILSANTWVVCSAIGVSGILTLSLASFGVQNLVGFIYINDVEDKMKLAYVDFWGKRKELEFDVNDLIAELDQNKPSFFDFYQAVRLQSNDKLKFKLLHRYGVAVDPEKFAHFFGE